MSAGSINNDNIARNADAGVKRKRSSTSPESSNDVNVKKTHLSYVSEGTVLLVVGEKKTKFHIHAHKLSEVSTFFRAALESGFREAGERMITLSEDVETVDCFVQWVYHQNIEMVENVDLEVSRNIRVSENRNCNLYVFADKYDIPDLKRYAITKLFRIIWKCRPPAPFKVEKWYQHICNIGIATVDT